MTKPNNILHIIPDLIGNLRPTILCLAALLLVTSCAKWNTTETVDLVLTTPQDRNPEQWEQYAATIKAYKEREHFTFFARLDNAPEIHTSEKYALRCLPDSLDIVSLTNADNFSQNDAADLPQMKALGTKVLWQIDYAGRKDEFADKPALSAYIDKVIESVEANGLDGYSFTGNPDIGNPSTEEISDMMVTKLSKAKKKGQLLVFEGDPMSISSDNISKIDLFVLDTDNIQSVSELGFKVMDAVDVCGIPAEKILLSSPMEGIIIDEKLQEADILCTMLEKAVPLGPLGGIAFSGIGNDYFHYGGNYTSIRSAIQTLNPSR